MVKLSWSKIKLNKIQFILGIIVVVAFLFIIKWVQKSFAIREGLDQLKCTGWPSGGTGNNEQKCLHGNTLNDGYDYVYNKNRGRADAACGQFNNSCWCCRRQKANTTGRFVEPGCQYGIADCPDGWTSLGDNKCKPPKSYTGDCSGVSTVSYTHLTLPTKRIV